MDDVRTGSGMGTAQRATFILPPALALLVASPMALSVLGHGDSSTAHGLVSLPFFLGLMCAPGFAHAALVPQRARAVARAQRWWIRLSLLGAVACGMAGAVGGAMVVLLLLPSLVSTAAAVHLLREFERGEPFGA